MSENIVETEDLIVTRLVGPNWVERATGTRRLYQINARIDANDASINGYVTLTRPEAEQLCRGLAADLGLSVPA